MIATSFIAHASIRSRGLGAILVVLAVLTTSSAATARPAKVVVFEAKVHSEPRPDAPVLELVVEGTALSVDETSADGWRRVRLENNKGIGWIRDVDLGFDDGGRTPSTAPSPAPERYIVGPNATNLRHGPSLRAPFLRTLVVGDMLTQRGPPVESFLAVTTDEGVEGYVLRGAVRLLEPFVDREASSPPSLPKVVVTATETAVFDEASDLGREKIRVREGDSLQQLAVPADGFVYVRTPSGVAGYVAVTSVGGVTVVESVGTHEPVVKTRSTAIPRPVTETTAPKVIVTVMHQQRFTKGSALVKYALRGPMVPSAAKTLDSRASTATWLFVGAGVVALAGTIPGWASSSSDAGPSDSDLGIAVAGAVVGGIAALIGLVVKPGDDDYHELANVYSALNPQKPVAYEPPTQVFIYGPNPYAVPR